MVRKAAISARQTLNNRNRNSQKLLAASAAGYKESAPSPVLDFADITQKVLSAEIELNGKTFTAHYLPFNAATALAFYDHRVIVDADLLYRFVWITSHGWCDENGNLKFAPLGFDEHGNAKSSPTASREDYESRKVELTGKTSFQFWNLLAGLILGVSGFNVRTSTESADTATEENPTQEVQNPSSTPPKNTADIGADSAT